MARLSRKSQVTIPADLRRSVGLELGDEIAITEEPGCRIVITKQEPKSWLERLEAFRGDHWNGAGEELVRDRQEWDQRA